MGVYLRKEITMKKLVALFLALCTTGCATTGLRQSALRETPPDLREAPPGHTAPLPTPPVPDITGYADLLGTSTEKVEKIFGTPDSVGIISAGKECFSRMRYWNIRFMGKSADLEIDEHHQEVTQVKIKFTSIPAGQRQEVIKEIREGFLPKHDEYHRTSQPGYQWKDKKGNIVSFSYANPSLEIGYTSENWLKFLSAETSARLPIAETEPGDMFANSTKGTESADIAQEELEHLESVIEEVPESEAATPGKDKGPGVSFEEEKQMEGTSEQSEKLEVEAVAEIESPREIEERGITKEEESKKPLYAKIDPDDLRISGFAQSLLRHYELDSQNDSFSLHRVRLKFDGHVLPELRYCIEIDATDSWNILRDAYIEYTGHPFANIIVGQTYIPFSEEKLQPPTDLEFIDRSRVTSNLSYDRDIGVQVRGEVFHETLSYGAGVFNGAGRNTSDNNDSKDIIARAVISPFKDMLLEGLSLGAAFQYGKQPRSGNAEGDRTVIGALAKYEYDKLKIQSEYLFRSQEQIAGLSDKDADGLYIMAAYHFLPKLQGAIRYEQYDPDRDTSGDREDIITLGVNYFFNDYLKLQANYLLKDEETEVSNNEFALQLQMKF